MSNQDSLDEEISKIMFHSENGDTDLFDDPEFQQKLLAVANEALKSGHPDGDYLLSMYFDCQGEPLKGKDKKLNAALNGNSNAIMEYSNMVEPENITLMGLLMARKIAMGSDTASPYQDYDYILETCDEAFLREVTARAESIRKNLERKGLKFSW